MADKVVVTSKHNDDDQYIWESDAASFSVAKDPRGNTLKRGTQITYVHTAVIHCRCQVLTVGIHESSIFRLHLKEEASEYLQLNTIKDLVTKYSQFINFNIYLWDSRKETVEEPIEEEEADESTETKSEDSKDEEKEDDDAEVQLLFCS